MNGQKIMEKRQNRLLNFFDSVLSIAMTVLALEIVIPQLSAVSTAARSDFFISITCYLISFVAMSTLWYIHNNFFSTHNLSGNAEIIMHLVLLFVVTLFQPLTSAIAKYPNDPMIRTLYLVDFFAMYGLLAMIIIYVRKQEEQFSRLREKGKKLVQKKRDDFLDSSDSSNLSDDAKQLRHILQFAYALEHPQELQEKMAEYMPEEYQKEWNDLRKKRDENYRMSLYAVFTMAAAVAAAAVLLIFSVFWSYAVLAAGLFIIILIRHHSSFTQSDDSAGME